MGVEARKQTEQKREREGVRQEAVGIAIQFVYVAILSVCVRLVYDLMEQYSKRLDRVVFQFYLLSPVKFNSFAKGCT